MENTRGNAFSALFIFYGTAQMEALFLFPSGSVNACYRETWCSDWRNQLMSDSVPPGSATKTNRWKPNMASVNANMDGKPVSIELTTSYNGKSWPSYASLSCGALVFLPRFTCKRKHRKSFATITFCCLPVFLGMPTLLSILVVGYGKFTNCISRGIWGTSTRPFGPQDH